MPSPNAHKAAPRGSIRPALLDLVSRAEAARAVGGLFADERDLLAALQAIIDAGQRPAERLLSAYHPGSRDALAGVIARYPD